MKESEFTSLVLPLRDRMFRYAQSLLLSPAEAEDAVHDLLRRHRADSRRDDAVAGWTECSAAAEADRWEMRRLINSFLSPAVFLPEGSGEWEEAFRKYKSVTSKK